MSRVVVIGAGVAGLTAATRLAKAGVSVTLLSKGLGGLQLSQGTVDVLGYRSAVVSTGSTSGGEVPTSSTSAGEVSTSSTSGGVSTGPTSGSVRVSNPLAAVAELAGAEPGHPYAVIGEAAVREGVGFLQGVLGPELLVGDGVANHQLPTAVGAVRPTFLAQPSMVAGACTDGAKFVIVGLRRLKDFHAALIAGNLSRTVLDDGGRLRARHLVVDVPARAGEFDSSGLSYARAFDDPGFRARFVAELGPLLDDGETVGLPGVLGLKDRTAWRDLADRLGHPVFEIPLPPPSVPGMRLNEALTAAAKAAGVRVVPGSRVLGTTVEDGRVTSVAIEAAGGSREFPADAFVLATGGFESGALTVDSYGTVSETLFGLPLAGAENPDDLIHGDYWGPDQPLFAVGVNVAADMRVVGPDGTPVHTNLYAAGGILAGAYRWSEKSGEGIALGSAVKAADAITKELA